MERKDPKPKGPTGPQPIAGAIRQFMKESGLNRPRGDERTFRAWTDAAGPRWQASAEPVALRGGELVVEVASSVHLSELKGYHSESIRARANAALGETRIHKVVFKLKS